ncbi:MAG: response regulator [Candidatus Sulfotelmatobacter sp.]|jgi:YesN/AraC family two-component response regulator
MTPTEPRIAHKVLLVDDDDAIRTVMTLTLENKGFEVVSAANVTEALKLITTESFDVLITDLHMPHPSDGFAVITAMRHLQPKALTLLVSGYPDVKSAMDAILLEADEIIVKPVETKKLADLVHDKLLTRKLAVPTPKERVAGILQRCTGHIVEDWLARVKKNPELIRVALSDQERTRYLPKLIEDLVLRLRSPHITVQEGDSIGSAAAVAHGKLRRSQGYTSAMLVQDSRILQVTLFGTLQKNLGALDFSLLLPDVMTIADEVDSQLTQAMEGYMGVAGQPAAA